MNQYRHGDVFLKQVEVLPAGAKKSRTQKGKGIVLAYGEVTGHSHKLGSASVALYEDSGRRYVEVAQPSTLDHEEHGKIEVAPGIYEVLIQRVYSPEEIRNVAD